MRVSFVHNLSMVALLLTGSAILLISCAEPPAPEQVNLEKMMTQQSDTLTIIHSENGRRTYCFRTPLMERYEYAREPYMEFRYGVYIETYDSTQRVSSMLRSDYAIYFEKRKLWEVKGNVDVLSAEGERLNTQQLFWNQTTRKIYSNVDTRYQAKDDDGWSWGEGFEADDFTDHTGFRNWRFRKLKGRMKVDAEMGVPRDSSAVQEPGPVPDALPQPGPDLSLPVPAEAPARRPVRSRARDERSAQEIMDSGRRQTAPEKR